MKHKFLLIMLFLLIVFSVCFSGCINIKSSIKKHNTYHLKQEKIKNEFDTINIEKSIFVKNFTIKTELSSEKIIIIEDSVNIVKCNYHLWTIPLDEMLTDFTIDRLTKYNIFKKGVVSSITMLPDLILECRIIDCNINNSVDKNFSNNVDITISANVYKAEENSSNFVNIFSKVYIKVLKRSDNSISSAVSALSNCSSDIIDEIILDIYKKLS